VRQPGDAQTLQAQRFALGPFALDQQTQPILEG
jgi:hypothetical protein